MASPRGARLRFTALAAVLAVLLAACGGGSGDSGGSGGQAGGGQQQTRKVDVMLDWIVDIGFGALAYGQDQGAFKQQGIDLNVIPGRGSDLAMQQINQDKVPFAFTDLSTYLTQRLKGQTETTAVYAWMNTAHAVIVSLDPINSPADLAGKSFGTVAFSSGRQTLPYLLSQNGVDPKSVQVKLLDFGVLYPSLFDGKIDTAEAALAGSYEPAFFAAQKTGRKLHYKRLSEWGLKDYGKLLIVRDDVMRDDPDLVRRVVGGFHASITEALAKASGQDVFQALRKRNPQTVEDQTMLGWDDFKQLIKSPGPIDQGTIDYALKFLADTQGLKVPNPAPKLFDNSFIPSG